MLAFSSPSGLTASSGFTGDRCLLWPRLSQGWHPPPPRPPSAARPLPCRGTTLPSIPSSHVAMVTTRSVCVALGGPGGGGLPSPLSPGAEPSSQEHGGPGSPVSADDLQASPSVQSSLMTPLTFRLPTPAANLILNDTNKHERQTED